MRGVRLGPFRLEQPIGRGGMGEVWRAEHDSSKLPVAVKILQEPWQPAWNEAFAHEVRAAAALSHPHIVTILDYGQVDSRAHEASEGRLEVDRPYLAMELAEGTLEDGWLADEGWPELRRILLAILDALSHAHARGVVHRDLKPANLLRGPKLADFGLAWSPQHDDPFAGQRVGTPAYMAPELLLVHLHRPGPWTDLFALGGVGWALATGLGPFALEAVPSSRILFRRPGPFLPRFEVPEGFESWLRWLLVNDPRTRVRSAAAAARALLELSPGPPPPWALRAIVPQPVPWRRAWAPVPARLLAGAGRNLLRLREWPIIGRDTQQQALWDAFEHCCTEGRTHHIVLDGPPGVGCRALAQWLAHRTAELGLARPLDLPEGEDGAVELITRLLNEFPSTRGHAQQIERALAAWSAPDPELTEILMRQLETPWELTDEEAGAAVATLLEHAASVLPCVLVVEGAGNAPILEALEGRRAPILVVQVSQGEGEPIAVEALEATDHAALVGRLLPLSPPLAATIAQHTLGNPSLAIELVANLAEDGVLVDGYDGFSLQPGAHLELPASLVEQVGGRLERALKGLEPAQCHGIERFAAFGGRAGSEGVDALAVDPDALERLARAGMAQHDHGTWRMGPAVRSALLDRARGGERLAEHHAACAACWAARGPSPWTRSPEGRHLAEAGQLEPALERLAEAIPALLSRVSSTVILELLAVDQSTLEAAALPPSSARMAWHHAWRAEASRRFDTGDAHQASETALTLAREHGHPAVEATALRERGFIRMLNNEDEAAADLRAAAELFRALGDEQERGRCLGSMAHAHRKRGELDRSEVLFREAVELFSRLGPPLRLGQALQDLGSLHLARGDNQNALPLFREAYLLLAEHGNARGRARAAGNLGAVLRALGQLEEARRHFEEAIDIHRRLLGVRDVVALLNLAELALHLGHYDTAQAHLEPLLAELEERGQEGWLPFARAMLLPVLARAGEWVRWDALSKTLDAQLSRTGLFDADIARALELAGEEAAATRHSARARTAWEGAAAQWAGLGREEEARRLEARASS